MKFLLSLFLFTSTGLGAENEAVILEMKLRIDDKLVSQPKIISISGETASIESVSKDGNGIVIEVTPTLQHKNQVHMKFVVAKMENHKKNILSEPQIISLLGQSAEITQEMHDKPQKTISLVVTPMLKD